jgi:single-stranded-DNA-specific exonuclease
LARIRAGRAHAGIRALLHVAGREVERVVATDLAFAVGPRLNAAGRLTDMALGIECLLSDDDAAAQAIARRLDDLNKERREIEFDMRVRAKAQLGALRLDGADEMPFGLCLFDEDWHQGVIGILASRIKEQVHRPVIAFAPQDDVEMKGSARSIPGLHIRDALDAVAARNPDLIRKFGGHAMAAGLSLRRENFELFSAAFDAQVRHMISEDDLRGTLHSDGPLQAPELDLTLAETLRWAGPWGQGFPEPLFDGEFEVRKRRIVGERHLKLELGVPGSRRGIDAIAFNTSDDDWPDPCRRVQIAYRLDVNVYQGLKRPQLIVEHLDPIQS